MGLNFRIIGKIGFLLVVIGFFMPMACGMNGFELAENLAEYADSGSYSMLLYALFISALAGIIIGALLLMKKNLPGAADWIPLLVCIVLSIYLLTKNEFELQSGAYVIITGCVVALVGQIIESFY